MRLRRPLVAISLRHQDVRSRCPRDVSSGHPRDGQIGCLGNVLGTFEVNILGRSWGPVFASWEGSTGLKQFNNSKAFIEYSNDLDDIYNNIHEGNPNEKCKILIALDDMIDDMLCIKKRNAVVT